MKKYLIKRTYTALEENQTFKKGYQSAYYIGRQVNGYQSTFDELCPYIIENGWNRKCDAQRVMNKDNEMFDFTAGGFWNVESEIIECEL